MATLRPLTARLLGMARRPGNVSAALHITIIRIIALVGNVCCGLLTAAYLGPDGRGEQAALLVAPSILGAASTLGLHASLIYNVRNDPEHAPRFFGSAILLCFGLSLVSTLAGYVVMPFWLHQYSPVTITLSQILLFAVPVGVTSPLLTGVLEAHGRFGVANRVLYLQSLVTLLLLLGLALGGWMTPHITALAYVLPCLPSATYLWWQAQKAVRPVFSLKAPFPGLLLRYGVKFYGVDILGVLSGYLDQAVIVFLLDPAAVGAYAVALSLSRILTVVQGAVATVLFPTIAGRDASSVVEIVGRVTRVTIVINGLGALGVGLVGPFLLLLLYGHRFYAAVTPFLILLIEAVVTSAARTLAQAFSGSGKPGAVTTTECAGVVVSMVSMLLLVPSLGIDGAACATLLGGCARFAWVAGSFHSVLGFKLPSLCLQRADLVWIIQS